MSFPVVGIGASAGGVEALEQFFSPMPSDTGAAFVIVTHLGPGHESMLGDILSRHTAMRVVAALDGEAVQPNHVYVMRREGVLTIKERRLHLRDTGLHGRERNPIDIFFSALAEDVGEHAVGIVLSGSDGTLGIKEIKAHGGLTLAQGIDHSTPGHGSMPASAIATGLVDLVLPVDAMAEKVAEYTRSFGQLESRTDGDAERLATAKAAICQVLRNQLGHDFAGYKDKTFLRRVQRRMQILRMAELDAYVERLGQDPGEASALFRDLLISVTHFFRDSDAFAALEETVLPKLFGEKGADDTVRVWVPGCATGEEAYSLAILLREHMDGLRGVPKVQVFATDIDEAALAVARVGRYPRSLLKGVSPERVRRFFADDGDSCIVAKEVRELCIFSAHSIVRDPPFARIDLVSCRNLLIYLSSRLQKDVFPIFHFALRAGGFLFLGISENASQHPDLFTPVDRKRRIFKRRDHIAQTLPSSLLTAGRGLNREKSQPSRPASGKLDVRQQAELRVLERHAPAHVIVNRDHDIVYYSARTGKYLEAAPGEPSRQLLTAARKGLRLDLRAALAEAAETGRTVTRERVPAEVDDRVQLVTLTVDRLPGNDGDPLFLVLFADVGPPVSADAAQAAHQLETDATHEQIEQELRATRERLQSTIEEYETAIEELRSANEEMVSVNEELQSSNEELETSREELVSLNEEITTINIELNQKVDALDRANSDLKNLFESTRIATIFLDRHLVIRSFTPAVAPIFNLIPADQGRPLTDIANRLVDVDLRGDIRTVLDGREILERRVAADGGKTRYLMRLLPYRASDNSVDGVLLTFLDITSVVAAEERQQLLIRELNHRVRNMLAVVQGLARQTLARSSQPDAFAAAFLGRLHAMAGAYESLSHHAWGGVKLRDLIERQLKLYVSDMGRVTVEGPAVSLRPEAAMALGMVFHELATNAVKYGALSNAQGRVLVTFSLAGPKGERRLSIAWKEHGGPPVGEPAHRGFGSELITRTVNQQLDGEATIRFNPAGVHVTMDLPFGAAAGR